jgi:hypothetical protein
MAKSHASSRPVSAEGASEILLGRLAKFMEPLIGSYHIVGMGRQSHGHGRKIPAQRQRYETAVKLFGNIAPFEFVGLIAQGKIKFFHVQVATVLMMNMMRCVPGERLSWTEPCMAIW